MSDGDLREQLGRLVRQLVREGDEGDAGGIARLLQGHLGTDAVELPVLTEELHAWELPNLQLALDAAVERQGWEARVVGLSGQAKHYDLGLSDLVRGSGWMPSIGAPEFVNAAVGPSRTLPCLALAVLLVGSPAGPVALFVRRGVHHGMGPALAVQATARGDGVATQFLTDLRALMEEHNVFRGQVLTVKADPMGSSEIVFLERPRMGRDDVILPDGLLETIERHVTGPSRHRETLLAGGRHLSRGVLLWGPPGTGKTHTVRYLTGLMSDATVVILSGATLGGVGAFAELARRLAPAMIVLEDVDLVAQERTFGPFGSSPVLYELMNQMDGMDGDADIAFVLTTNRPDALEPALAARPGRIDLAVEVPLPDEDARQRLLELYGRGLDLQLADARRIVSRMEGVTASFVKEVLRNAALRAAELASPTVTDEHVDRVLDELLAETAALTRILLGGERPATGSSPDPHAWLGGFTT